jgi:hypothetical protein
VVASIKVILSPNPLRHTQKAVYLTVKPFKYHHHAKALVDTSFTLEYELT